MSPLNLALAGLCTLSCAFAAPQRMAVVYSVGPAVGSVLVEVKRETARLMAAADFGLEWIARDLSALRHREFENLVVVRFTGSCSIESEDQFVPASAHGAGSLATTAVSDGQVLPFVNVDCERTRRMMAPVLTGLPAIARDLAFGRALGRVVAHELYHVLAKTTAHQENGVSKPCFRLADLVAPAFRFDGESIERMRPAFARVQEVGEAGEVDGAETGGR